MSPVEELLHRLVKAPTILLVTNCAEEAARIAELLTKFHCHVVPQCSVGDAISIMRGRPVDLLLVDNRLDSVSEAQLLSNATVENPSMPIVVLTGYGNDVFPAQTTYDSLVGLYQSPRTERDFERLFSALRLRVRKCPEAVPEQVNTAYIGSATA